MIPEVDMTFTINGRADSVDSQALTVVELLRLKDVTMPEMVSVQLNGDILDRSAFESTMVKEGDDVEFLYFMGGGAWKPVMGGGVWKTAGDHSPGVAR